MKQSRHRDLFLGERARRHTVENFSVIQKAHYINLSDTPVDSVFKKDLKEVYIIELVDKRNDENRRSYVVGCKVAGSLFQLTGQEPIPLFHPFSDRPANSRPARAPSAGKTAVKAVKPRTPLNEELYQALSIVLSVYGYKRPDGLFANLLVEVRDEFPGYDVKEYKIKNFDKALKKFDRTLYEIIAELRARYPDLRDFSFPLMEKILGPNSSIGTSLLN